MGKSFSAPNATLGLDPNPSMYMKLPVVKNIKNDVMTTKYTLRTRETAAPTKAIGAVTRI